MTEEFKICGLCSQLVVEAVFLENQNRAFLVDFLEIANINLPSKICTDCFQGCYNSLKFKENCMKAINKLSSSKLGDDMILGRSAEEKKRIRSNAADVQKLVNKNPIEAPLSRQHDDAEDGDAPLKSSNQNINNSNKKQKSKGRPKSRMSGLGILEQDLNNDLGPRSTRSRDNNQDPLANAPVVEPRSTRHTPAPASRRAGPASSKNNNKNKNFATPEALAPRSTRRRQTSTSSSVSGRRQGDVRNFQIIISPVEKRIAEEASHSGNNTLSHSSNSSRKRKASGSLKTGLKTPTQASPSAKKAKTEVSSFGRVRNRTAKAQEIDLEIEENFVDVKSKRRSASTTAELMEYRPARAARRSEPVLPATKPKPASAAKKTPAKSKPKTASKKNKRQQKAQEVNEVVDLEDEDEENAEEMFPSIGPYQCEICQVITNTKQEFVDHIKQHHMDVVDEEVLRSLEKDLKRQKSKTGASPGAKLKVPPKNKRKPPTPKAKPRRKPASKKPPPKKAVNNKATPNGIKESPSKNAFLSMNDLSPEEQATLGLEGEVEVDNADHDIGDAQQQTNKSSTGGNFQSWKANVAKKFEQEKEENPIGTDENNLDDSQALSASINGLGNNVSPVQTQSVSSTGNGHASYYDQQSTEDIFNSLTSNGDGDGVQMIV